jgi:hypothetical protein
MSNKKIDLKLTAPHPAQWKIIREAKRFNVICCGRRWGKTVLGMDRLIEAALQHKPVAWFSPTNKLMADTWRALRSTLAPITRDKSEQEKRLELIGGGVIDLWSLDSLDSGRGRKYAVVVIDEAAMIPELEAAWQESIRPTLTDLGGSAWFLSTPKGMNYFQRLFDRGQDCEREDWASWQMPTSANPYLDSQEIEAARLDLTEAAFNQEYLALFVDWEGSVFHRVGEAATALSKTKPEPGHDYVIGCDWGRSQDYTVFLVLDITARAVVALDRSNRVDYTLQCGRLRSLNEHWRPKQIIAEQNSIGQPVIEQLERDGLRIQPFTTTNASKAQAIEALALAFERGDIRILNDAVLVSELVAYQAERLPSGLMRYGAPSGQHDDCVMALAIAWVSVSGPHRPVYPVPESDLLVEPFEIPAGWPRVYALYVGPGSIATIWGALDPSSGVIYLYCEYCSKDDLQGAQAWEIRSRGRKGREVVRGVIGFGDGDPRDQGELIEMYRKWGLDLEPANSLVESGIAEVRQRMADGRLKVFASLTNYWEELRQYRRDERGQVVKASGNIQDATRCLVASGVLRVRPQQEPVPWCEHRYTDGLGWLA